MGRFHTRWGTAARGRGIELGEESDLVSRRQIDSSGGIQLDKSAGCRRLGLVEGVSERPATEQSGPV
jgi:hypothetical protein